MRLFLPLGSLFAYCNLSEQQVTLCLSTGGKMGLAFSRLWERMFGKKEMRILMVSETIICTRAVRFRSLPFPRARKKTSCLSNFHLSGILWGAKLFPSINLSNFCSNFRKQALLSIG